MFPVLHVLELPFGDFVLHAYGACVAFGVLAAWYALGATKRDDRMTFLAATLSAIAAGALGAAALSGHPLGTVGFAMPAWILAVVGVAHVRRTTAPMRARLVGGALLVAAFEGVGAWLAGSRFGACAGDPLSRLAGVYPRWASQTGSPAWYAHREAGWIANDATASLPTHPVTLYETAFALLLAVVVLRTRTPRVTAAAGVAFALGFAGLELLREHHFDATHHGNALALALALLLAASCAPALRSSRRPTDAT